MTFDKKILIVEDNPDALEYIADTFICEVLGEPESAQSHDDPVQALRQRGVDVATTYADAERYVQENVYDAVFLDHNLPRANNKFSESIGYGLISVIRNKNPNTMIIGTSSMPPEALNNFDKPDHQINKVGEELEIILKDVLAKDSVP